MKRAQIDVSLEIPYGEMLDSIGSTADKNALAAALVERVRGKAEEEARRVGGRVVTDTPPEFYIRRGSHVVKGGDWFLVASRWTVDVPNAFDERHATTLLPR